MHCMKNIPCKNQKLTNKSLGSKHRKRPFTLLTREGEFQETPKQHVTVIVLDCLQEHEGKKDRGVGVTIYCTTHYLEQLS